MNVRPATNADFAAITAILEANDEPVTWPGVERAPYVEHLLSRPGAAARRGRARWERRRCRRTIEFGRPDRRFLTDLYVDPGRQSRGLGRQMLDAAMEGATERMTFSSSDRRALAAYIRSGMRPCGRCSTSRRTSRYFHRRTRARRSDRPMSPRLLAYRGPGRTSTARPTSRITPPSRMLPGSSSRSMVTTPRWAGRAARSPSQVAG
jgi:ribosomal protein S18 acetylase RimI-like enzyme